MVDKKKKSRTYKAASLALSLKFTPKYLNRHVIETPEEAKEVGIRIAREAAKDLKLDFKA